MLYSKSLPPFSLEFFAILQRAINMRGYTDASTQTTTEETVEEQVIANPLNEETLDEQTIKNPPKKEKDNSWMFQNANQERVVVQFMLDDIQESADEVTIKGGYELLCSYSWKNTDTTSIYGPPVIYVPGTPPAFDAREFATPTPQAPDTDGIQFDASTGRYWTWVDQHSATTPSPHQSETQPFHGIQLPPDTGRHWVDQHAVRAPTHQFEPIFQSLSVLSPSLRFNAIDIVVNRSSLQMLLRYLNAKSSQPLLLDLDIVSNTLFLGRRVRHAKVASMPGSYGRSFEEYFTAEDPRLDGADGHHRVLRYEFGGLDMVVRIEADAYMPGMEYDVCEPIMPHPFFDAEMSIATKGVAHALKTEVIPKGTLAPHFLTIELKSNEKVKPMEQMWLGRTPNAFLGRCKAGVLKQAVVEKASAVDFEEWEKKNQASLRKLAWLLRELRGVVKMTSEGSAVLVAMGKGQPMEVYEVKKKVGALPKEIVERFWDGAE
jgi:hypothetical protein